MTKKDDLLSSREEVTDLYDIYKPLIAEAAIRRFEEYYFDDLSLSEIAEIEGVSRSAIHEALSKTVEKLFSYEKKMKLLAKKQKLASLLEAYKLASINQESHKAEALWKEINDAL